jgi:hypothetical protein
MITKQNEGENFEIVAKRVNIVSVKLVKESTFLYKRRSIRSPQDAYELLKEFLEDKDREHFFVETLYTCAISFLIPRGIRRLSLMNWGSREPCQSLKKMGPSCIRNYKNGKRKKSA